MKTFKFLHIDLPSTLLLAIGIALYWLMPLNDPDFFWHLKTGELIYTTSSLPTTDPFSFTRQGAEWVLHEWLFQLLIYMCHLWFGEYGLRVLVLGSIALCLYFTHLTMRTTGLAHHTSTILLIWLLLSLITFITPRPQLASYLFFAYYLNAIYQALKTREARHLHALPLLMILWVNMHGGYLIGVTLLALATASTWLEGRLRATSQAADDLTRRLLLTTVATLLASSVNPDFISHWKYPFYVLSMEATAHIEEWHSPDFAAPYAQSFLAVVIFYTARLAAAKQRPSVDKLLIPAFFIVAAISSARNIPFALISMMALLPNAGGLDSRRFQFLHTLTAGLTGRYRALASRGREMGKEGYLLNWFTLLLLFAILSQLNLNPGAVTDTYPHKAVDFFVEQGLQGNILSEYKNGGYLLYRLYPDSHVFIDGRADMYGDRIVLEHAAIMSGAKEWRALFEKYNIDYIICSNRAPIYQKLLESARVEILYSDPDYSVIRNFQHSPEEQQP